VKLPAK